MKVTIEQDNGEMLVIETDALALVAHMPEEEETGIAVIGCAPPAAWAGICNGLNGAVKKICDGNTIVRILLTLASDKDVLEQLKKLEEYN